MGDEVHDLLDCLPGRAGGPPSEHSQDLSSPDPPDPAQLRAAADACEGAMEALAEALGLPGRRDGAAAGAVWSPASR